MPSKSTQQLLKELAEAEKGAPKQEPLSTHGTMRRQGIYPANATYGTRLFPPQPVEQDMTPRGVCKREGIRPQ